MPHDGISIIHHTVHLATLRLRDFRNYDRLDTAFDPGFHLFLGENAQGKTNLLEAIYMLSTLRSFRGATGLQLVREGKKGYFIGAQAVATACQEFKVFWSTTERQVSIDGRPVHRMADFFGKVRAVVFCSDDLQLVKGPSPRRRRFLDLLLAQTHPTYLSALQRYSKALKARNALLKQRNTSPSTLDSFSRELVNAGKVLIASRADLTPKLSALAKGASARLAPELEDLRVDYRPCVRRDFDAELAASAPREAIQRTTVVGPHRDDFDVLINERPAARFASEGQKRTVAIALKMAQAQFLTTAHGSPPILLIDDVMGELDVKRRAGLLPLLERAHHTQGQVFMTCTEENWPAELGRKLHRWHVHAGTIRRQL